PAGLLATGALAGKQVGDSVSLAGGSIAFASKDVGTGKTVAFSGFSLTGDDAGNYSLANTTASTTADITPKALTVSATGVNKVYDGTTAATVNLADDRVVGDLLTDASSAASFADKNVGTAKTVSVTGIAISGADAANYTANETASTTADITPKALTVSAAGVNKVYDGTTAATVNLSDDRVAGDDVSDASTAASFADKNV